MKKKRIGLVVAVEMDAVLQKYGTPVRVDKKAGFTVHVYENDKFELYAVDSGAGEINAANATQFVICTYDVDVIVNFGVVGALEEEAKTAQLCVVEQVVHYDFDTTGWLNLNRGQYPGYDSAYVAASPELIQLAKSVSPELRSVICASADKFVDVEADKWVLNEIYGAHICEMEAAGILLTCSRNGVPCLLLKAVSDSLVGGGKEFLSELNRVSLICFELVDKVIQAM